MGFVRRSTLLASIWADHAEASADEARFFPHDSEAKLVRLPGAYVDERRQDELRGRIEGPEQRAGGLTESHRHATPACIIPILRKWGQ
jgi:hypothetical protein